MTHEKGSPWEQVVTSYAGKWPRGTDIPIETIRKHFRELYENGKAES